MVFNRLKLDFSLQTAAERIDFLNEYLPTISFTMTEHEQETLSDYVLWGKDPKTGLNSQQDGDITIKEWAPNTNIDSLEGLAETPGFNENTLHSLNDTHYKNVKVKFSREDALAKAPPSYQEILKNLFHEIDRVELTINYYDLRVGKRKMPPRPSLLKNFDEEERSKIEAAAQKLIQRKYLKLRHYLVELRNEQYTIRDSFVNVIMPRGNAGVQLPNENLRFDDNIQVWPVGFKKKKTICNKIFKDLIDPNEFTEAELNEISKLIWRPKHELDFDFRNPDHILYIYKNYDDLVCAAQEDPEQLYNSAKYLLDTLEYYHEQAHLTEIQEEILHFKIQNISNISIAAYINSKYHMTYNSNYISTIYRHKILTSIAHAAENHYLIMSNVFWPENFKVCKDCGQIRLRNAEFFMRQSKSVDGFVPRCKKCQAIKRIYLKERREARKQLAEQQLETNGCDLEDATN